MIDFALSSLQSTPPRLLFMSSIGVLARKCPSSIAPALSLTIVRLLP